MNLEKKDRRIGDLTFASKKTLPPLQAADMIAYALQQSAERVFILARETKCFE